MWPFRAKQKNAKPARHGRATSAETHGWRNIVGNGGLQWAFDSGNFPNPANLSRVALRERARLVKFNPYVVRYLSVFRNIVLGPNGFNLSVNAVNNDGKPDKQANDAIEWAWFRFAINVSSDNRFSLHKLLEKACDLVCLDGEVFLWFQRVDGEFKIMLLDAEMVHQGLNEPGRRIYEGIQYDQYNRPVKYFVLPYRPDKYITGVVTYDYIEVPARDMVHLYTANDAADFRGTTLLASSLNSLHHLHKYIEAVLVKARVSASKMAAYSTQDAEVTTEFDGFDEQDAEGKFIDNMGPGHIAVNPRGWRLDAIDWKDDHADQASFIKQMLKEVSSGLMISYHLLTSDLSESNYSSLKFNSIMEKAYWAAQQRLFIAATETIYKKWLEFKLLSGELPYPVTKIEKFTDNSEIRGYQLPDIDPQKEIKVHETQLALSLRSRTEILAEAGKDFETVLAQIQKEKQLMEQYGVEDLLEAQIAKILGQNDAAKTEKPE